MLQIHHLSLTMRRDLRPLLKDLELFPQPGERLAVIGEEGNGKSTLLKLIYDEKLVEDYVDWTGEIQKGGMTLA